MKWLMFSMIFFTSVANTTVLRKIFHQLIVPQSLTLHNAMDPLFDLNNNLVTASEISKAIKSFQQKKTLDMFDISVTPISKFSLTLSTPLRHILSLSFSNGVDLVDPQQLKWFLPDRNEFCESLIPFSQV